jgi:hypothetical protein
MPDNPAAQLGDTEEAEPVGRDRSIQQLAVALALYDILSQCAVSGEPKSKR